MKTLIKFTALLVFLISGFSSISAQTTWGYLNGPNSGSINAIAQSSSYVFVAAGSSGVWRFNMLSGLQFTQTQLSNKTVISLLAAYGMLFAGTNSSGVYVTTNNGDTWTQTPLNDKSISGMTAKSGYIFAGSPAYPMGNGIWRSGDNGSSWQQVASELSIRLGSNSTYLYSSSSDWGIERSSDNGVNWEYTLYGNVFSCIATNGSTVFLGNENGIYRSLNNGGTYSVVFNAWGVNGIYVYDGNVFAGTWNGVYYSPNNGSTWYQKNQGLPNTTEINNLVIYPGWDARILAGASDGKVWMRYYPAITGIENSISENPSEFELSQNYPNPFNNCTNIDYYVPKSSRISITVYDASGKEVRKLVNSEYKESGRYTIMFNAGDLTSGVYFYRFESTKLVQTKRLVLLK